MKTCLCLNFRRGLFFALLCASLCLPTLSRAAVGLIINPSSISNTFDGQIALQITGLADGETVLIDKFVDYNTNGVVDANDMLVQSLRFGDGQANVFGGVTNMNSPGDLTPTNGAISTVISFYGTHPGKFIGNYVFRVSSPTGNFSPATTPFTVANSNFGQAISGAVRNNGTNVPYGGVFLLGGPNQNFIGGTFADSSGNFTIRAAPGTYVLGAAKSGYIFDFSTGQQVTLSSGVNASANANATAATRTISGTVRELGNPTKTLGGVEVNCEGQNGFVLAFSDTNGNFTIPVTADIWKVKMQDDLVGLMGYLAPDDEPARPRVDTTSGSVSGVNIDLPKVNALFYGNLKTSANNPLVGIGVGAQGSSGGSSYPYSSKGNTDANGNYFIGVVETNWNVGADSDTLSALGYSTSGTNTSINAGQAIQINFVASALTVHLVGRIGNNGGTPLSNVQLNASDWMGGNFSGSSDGSGNFDIGVTAGTWHLQLESESAAQQGLIGPELVFSNLVDGTTVSNINFVVQTATAQITGNVQDTNSSPITFVYLGANITVNGTNYSSYGQTDGSGNYSLGVFNGTWSVFLSGDDLSSRGFETPANQNVTISGGNGTVNYTIYPIQPLQITTTSLPPGVVSRNYHTNLQATGGQPPYTWSIVSGSLPPGVNFGSGLIDGIPTSSGTFSFTVQVSDQQAITTNKSLSITINPALQITTGSLPNGTNNVLYSANLTASGGIPPYTWQIGGPLPAGLNLSANSGTISGTPTGSGTTFFTVLVNDSNGGNTTRDLSIAINSSIQPLQITTTSLPPGVVSQNYHTNLQATGGQPPYTWSIVSGSLPPGVIFDSGLIDGIPTNSGTFNFTVQVRDGNGNSTNQSFSLVISGTALQVTTTFLPSGTNGAFYSQQLNASGGQQPYSWSLTPGSAPLPPNLTLANNGVLSGTPATNGTFYFYARVTDAALNTADSSSPLQLTIANQPLQITSVTLPSGTVGAAYSAQLGATGGQPPYSWSLAAGSASLPPNLSLPPSGIISGTPTTIGTFNFIVQATDASFTSRTKPLGLSINPQPGPVLGSPNWLTNQFQIWLTGVTGQNYTVELSTNVSSTNWTTLFITNSATANSFLVTDPNATNKQRFYRALVGP